MSKTDRKKSRAKIRFRIRRKIVGTAERPRLAVHFSNKNVYAQVIDDAAGKTLAAVSTLDEGIGASGACVESAAVVGREIAKRAKAAKLEIVVFDRGGFFYHGKVKALADAAREGGLQF